MAAGDLTTLSALKAWMPVKSTNTNADAVLSALISAVSADFARATKRPDLLTASYEEVRRGDGGCRLIAYHWPITAISELIVGTVTVPESSDKMAPGWYIDEDIDPERVWNIYLNGWYRFFDGQAIQLNYTAGYAEPPLDIAQAVNEWCNYRYTMLNSVTTTERRSTEGESAQTPQLDAPPHVLEVIERYTRCFPSIDRRAEEREDRLHRAAAPAKAMHRKGR